MTNGQYSALDHRKLPHPGQNIARTFRVFYGGGVSPDSQFALPRHFFRGSQFRGAFLVRQVCGYQRVTTAEHVALNGCLRVIRKDDGWLAPVAVRCVVFAVQPHLASADEGRQRGPAAGPVRSGQLDPGEADFSAVIEAKAAAVDDGVDPAFARWLEGA